MDFLQSVRKINTKPVNTVLIYSVIALLGMNYLLYSFFDLGGIKNLIRAAAAGLMLLLLVLRLADGKIRRRQMLMLILAVWQILSRGTNGLNIAFLLILTVALAGYTQCRVTTAVFWIMAGLTAVVVVSLLLGIEENEVYRVGNRIRHKLGFVNVNSASMFLFTLLAAYLLHRGQNAKIWDLAAVLTVELLTFMFTDSRTPMLGLILMVVLYLLLPKLPTKIVGYGCMAGIAVLFLTSYLWPLPIVNSDLMNKLLSLRPMYCDDYFRSQSALTFLLGGTRVPELDNGYLLLLFNTGVIVYTTIYFLMQTATKQMLQQGQYMQLSFVLTMLACSVLEGSAVRPELLCAPLLWILILEALPGEGRESLLLSHGQTWLAKRVCKSGEN